MFKTIPTNPKPLLWLNKESPTVSAQEKKKRREKPKGIGSSFYKESFQPKIKKQNQRRNT